MTQPVGTGRRELVVNWERASWSPEFVEGCELFPEGSGVLGWKGVCDQDEGSSQFGRVGAASRHAAATVRVPESMHGFMDEQFPSLKCFGGGSGPKPGAFQAGDAGSSSG